MKLKLIICLTLIVPIFSLLQPPSVMARKHYIDPVNGDDRNSGISPFRAKKSGLEKKGPRIRTPNQSQNSIDPIAAAEEILLVERIILGTEIVAGWDAFTQNIWKTTLELDSIWGLESVAVGGEYFDPGASADFLADGQFYLEPETHTFYLNDADGSPGDTGKNVSLSLIDYQTGENKTIDVDAAGWTATTPSVWQSDLPTEPIHVIVNNAILSYLDYWWGPVGEWELTGEEDTLYLRDLDGNPDTTGKKVEAVTQSGGWGVASGDFNGDGLTDVVHSSFRNKLGDQIFVNYGASDFSPTPKQILTPVDEQIEFGFLIASAGDVNNDGYDELLVANGWGDSVVFIYNGSAEGLSEVPSQRLSAPDGVPAFGFGHGIAGNGSINGDPYADILIMGGDESQSYLCVYLGSEEGVGSSPDTVLQFADNTGGGSVSIPGDLNRDGFDEVALSMGAAPPVDRIEVLVFNGTADGKLSDPRRLEISSPPKDVSIQAEVAPAGDINGDGFSDLLVGNQYGQGDYENEGKVYLFLGSAEGVSPKPDFTIDNPLPEFNIRFGQSLTGIGDWNHDGFGDFAVGCPYHQTDSGFVAVYFGGVEGIAATPSKIMYGVNAFGWSLAGGGDLKEKGQTFFITGEEFGGAFLYGKTIEVPGCGYLPEGCGETDSQNTLK